MSDSAGARYLAASAALIALIVLGAATATQAGDRHAYDDADANYLKVAYHFIYPVGKLAELVFFRPLHAIASRTQPIPSVDGYQERDVGRCIAFRPARGCTRD